MQREITEGKWKLMQSNAWLNLYNLNHHIRVWDLPLSGYCSLIKLIIVEHEWHAIVWLSEFEFHCLHQQMIIIYYIMAESEKSQIKSYDLPSV